MARGTYHGDPVPASTWPETVDRFFTMLAALDAALAEVPPVTFPAEVIFQGRWPMRSPTWGSWR